MTRGKKPSSNNKKLPPLRKYTPYEKVIGGVTFLFDKGTNDNGNTKYTEDRIGKIYALLKEEDYTIPSLCAKVGISEDTYYLWVRDATRYKGFKSLISACEAERLSKLKCITRNSILRKAKGWETEDITESSGISVHGKTYSNKTVNKKTIPPDTALLTWLAENLDGEVFKNRQHIVHSGNITNTNIEVEANKLKGLGVDKLRALMEISQEVTKNNNPEKI